MTINDLLARNVIQNPDKPYVFFKDKTVTYGEFDRVSNRVANALISLGVKKGDRVSIMLPNNLEFLYAMFGCFKLGAVIVPLNTALSTDEVKYVINHSEAVVLLMDGQYISRINSIRADLDLLKKIIVISDERPDEDFLLFSELIHESSSEKPSADVTGEDNLSIIYTSGTTGKPKGVVLTHNAYESAARAWNDSIGITGDDRPLSVLALFHINAQLYFAIGAMDLNTGFVLEEGFSSSRFWKRAVETDATVSCLPGNALVMLDNMPEIEMDTNHKLRIMISAYTPVDLYGKFEERFHLDIIEGYTLTESPSALFNRPGDVKIGSIGRPMTGVAAKIVDDEGNEVPQGEVGEIALKGPAVMKEYFKNPEATSEALKGGWLHTGDLGRVDEEGFFHFAGRKKDIIRRGGENIGAEEVEDVLNSHPKIAESAVIPVPDRIRNEEIKAFIIQKPGETLEPEEIIRHCEERLADFKVPRYIEFINSFPKTAKMTIKKHELKNLKEDHTVNCFDRLES
ncbi:MAG: AMP-binding protein [Deltaproteobacteria bacterium]|nr:AMP-binding protein [Deltaproteobacteria bacterium]